jgi:hypothetical protein
LGLKYLFLSAMLWRHGDFTNGKARLRVGGIFKVTWFIKCYEETLP